MAIEEYITATLIAEKRHSSASDCTNIKIYSINPHRIPDAMCPYGGSKTTS